MKLSERDEATVLGLADYFWVNQETSPGVFESKRVSAAVLVALASASAAVPPVQAVAGASHDLVAGDVGRYNRFTHSSAKEVTVQADATEPMPDDAEIHIRNAATGDLTLVEDAGVTINPSTAGTLVIPPGGTATLKRVAEDEWDLFGLVTPA